MSTIFEELNSEQRAAVECVDGPVLIVAGAGSGKTRVLTSRIAYTVEKGVDPSRILALTFTKKAAAEMKERIAAMVGERKARRLYMGTFHSVFIRFLREFADRIGYPSSFTIYDTSDSQSAIKACIKQLNLDDKVYKPKEVLSRISMAKNNLVTAAAYAANQTALMNDRAAKKPEIHSIYRLYAQLCRQSGVMDFDDILLNMNILLRDHPDALLSIADRFDYILVDEYQDTNFSQYLILKKLSQSRRNICVVGDDSQSIYAFRGARIENILNFKKDFPEAKTFRLERNYRSTRVIVNAANSLIAKNEARIPKNCVSVGEEGEKIRLIRAYTESEEALLIASSIISRMQSDHAEYQDFAILYRTNSQSRALEEALRKRNLPYLIYSGNSFFERAEVKDMMAYLKLAVNVHDDESFKRIVNKPARGIGDTSMSALIEAARKEGTSLYRAASLDLAPYGLRPAAVNKIRDFCQMIERHAVRAQTESASSVAASLSSESGLYRFYKEDMSIEGQSRAANVEELLNSVSGFCEDRQGEYVNGLIEDGTYTSPDEVPPEEIPVVLLGDFLEDISLPSAVDVPEEEGGSNRIALMTAHSAKGLEFPYVYVSGMEENLFPSGGNLLSENDLEEERRLFYVALTRAEKAVALTFATTRMRNGKHESNAPSRFLREIAPQYIANPLRKEEMHAHSIEEDDEPGFRFGSGGGFRRFGSGPSDARGREPFVRSAVSPSRHPVGAVSGAPVRVARQTPPPAPSASVSREALKNRPLPPKIPDADFIPDTMDKFSVGDRIEHNRFGFGRVLEISGQVPELKAKIAFDRYGEKILLLKYAKIRLVPLG